MPTCRAIHWKRIEFGGSDLPQDLQDALTFQKGPPEFGVAINRYDKAVFLYREQVTANFEVSGPVELSLQTVEVLAGLFASHTAANEVVRGAFHDALHPLTHS